MQTPRNRRRGPVLIATAAVLVLIAGGVGFIRAGIYNVGADDPHLPATHAMLTQLRDASIRARAGKLEVPADLMSTARITQGAGNYNAMCTQCHLAPGIESTELSRGLYPPPPDLTEGEVDAAEAFWVIKHGIKASGMPAWGGSMADEYIWNMAAFLRELPTLDEARYKELVASSGGHSHGGGESMPHHEAAPGDVTPGQAAEEPHHDAPGSPPHDH